ncbi:MAG: serine/threonine protein kinase [Oscillatoriales cyanobacterium]|nr:MAG: serine/threonine protein kinase [Oscillatoriales cyanobacterium]TAG19893.1 MAG: serine/threonine protein kinase [Oscillatoriales cyanobacterium]TAG48366.1 MAG: serine/threonine protein kinase [Oscillatoriales cyanobacterium]
MEKMTKQEFEVIYKNITSTQHSVLEMFLKGRLDPEISEVLYKDRTAVSSNISKICKLFGVENKPGAYTQRDDLIELFIEYKQDLVCKELLEKFGARASEPRKILEVPEGLVPLNSDFYIERSRMEADCYQQILRPGSMIRIKAPKLMGKTSLLNRIIKNAQTNEYRLVRLDFRDAEEDILKNTNKFFEWFCFNISDQLKLECNIDLQGRGGILVNCKKYFQTEVLEAINCPLVLALEEIDCIFHYEKTAQEFLKMLRSWFEETKKTDIWKNLRMVLLHSTNVYVELPHNQSPFNVGFSVELTEFNQPNILDLARRHQLSWGTDEVIALMAIVGGYPYLVRKALYHLHDSNLSLAEVLHNAATDVGIYGEHLYRHWTDLQKYSELKLALKQVVFADSSVKLEQVLEFKLLSTGLVKRHQHGITSSCRLYRDYFAEKFRD